MSSYPKTNDAICYLHLPSLCQSCFWRHLRERWRTPTWQEGSMSPLCTSPKLATLPQRTPCWDQNKLRCLKEQSNQRRVKHSQKSILLWVVHKGRRGFTLLFWRVVSLVLLCALLVLHCSIYATESLSHKPHPLVHLTSALPFTHVWIHWNGELPHCPHLDFPKSPMNCDCFVLFLLQFEGCGLLRLRLISVYRRLFNPSIYRH